MNDDDVTNLFAFRIDGFLDDQGSSVAVFDQHGTLFITREPKMKFGGPTVIVRRCCDGHNVSKAFCLAF
jgi:hypothetical protein